MIVAAAIDWTMVVTSLIIGLPAIISAIYAARAHGKISHVSGQIETPSGEPLGAVAEYAHDTVIANNLLLSKSNGPTKHAEPGTLRAEGHSPPMVPDPPQPAVQEG